jgi:gamma-glutamyltranspeptidase
MLYNKEYSTINAFVEIQKLIDSDREGNVTDERVMDIPVVH